MAGVGAMRLRPLGVEQDAGHGPLVALTETPGWLLSEVLGGADLPIMPS